MCYFYVCFFYVCCWLCEGQRSSYNLSQTNISILYPLKTKPVVLQKTSGFLTWFVEVVESLKWLNRQSEPIIGWLRFLWSNYWNKETRIFDREQEWFSYSQSVKCWFSLIVSLIVVSFPSLTKHRLPSFIF